MTDGTSQGLFIVVAIVIFGIFVFMAYILFEDTLSPAMANMFSNATEQARISLDVGNSLSIHDLKLLNRLNDNATVEKTGRNSLILSSDGVSLSGSGFFIDEKHLNPNREYLMQYDIQLLEGTLLKVGGHLPFFSNYKTLDNSETRVDYYRGIDFPQDFDTHTITVRFNTKGLIVDEDGDRRTSGTEDANIYIQPNREVTETLPFKVEISNFKFHEVK